MKQTLDVLSSPVFSPLNSNSTAMAKQSADSIEKFPKARGLHTIIIPYNKLFQERDPKYIFYIIFLWD